MNTQIKKKEFGRMVGRGLPTEDAALNPQIKRKEVGRDVGRE